MTGKRVKDFYRFVRSVKSFTDGQVSVLEWDEAELQDLKIQIQPNDGAYEGGRFVFTIKMANDFPESYPEVNCITEIYHPNIDPTSDSYNVCLSLFDEWTSSYGLRDVIQGLLFLFYNPNVDDPLSSYFGDSLTDEEFESNVRASLRGEDVEDYPFAWNYYGNDPEMLKHKPTKLTNKIENTEAPEVEKEAISAENAKNVEKTEDAETVAESHVEKVDNAETVESKEGETDETIPDDDDVPVVNDDNEAQDITVILEKMSELMLQYPEDEDEEKKEEKESAKEDTGAANTETVDENGQEQNNFVNTDSTEENVNEPNNENNPNGAIENTDSNSETDNANATAPEATPADSPLQRQTSKIERQCSIKEMSNDVQTVAYNTAEKMSSTHTQPSPHYTDAFSNFASPELTLAVNMFGAACYFVYKSFVK